MADFEDEDRVRSGSSGKKPLDGERTGAPVLARLALVAVLVVAVGLAVLPLHTRPDVVAGSAGADRVSAERAMIAVHAIADTPHPIASSEHGAVVNYLVATFAISAYRRIVERLRKEVMAHQLFGPTGAAQLRRGHRRSSRNCFIES